MKFTKKILSIPPYISTSWKNISALHIHEGKLLITLQSGATIELPELETDILEQIFIAHAEHLESLPEKPKKPKPEMRPDSNVAFAMPFKFGIEGLEGMGNVFEHNQSQSGAPDLPQEMLERIAKITEALGSEATEAMPKAEPHCNCFYCQVARAMQGKEKELVHPEFDGSDSEIVTDDELTFSEWKIAKVGEQTYEVQNPLSLEERYRVHLGSPVGCTCGEKNCNHIRAVLSS
ncbi:MAG: hypothetical protein SNF33_01160 [Candidatus Algichlamydia australiensis]|nr:hypothetical protein [Chlamydiales bacterium]